MKKIYKHILFAIPFGILLSGCGDFLDVDSQEKVEAGHSGEVFEPESFINGTYAMFTHWDYGFSYLAITDMISDNSDKGSSPGDPGGDKELIDNLTFTSTAGSVESIWKRWYKTIGRATKAIEYTEAYGIENEAYKDRLIGEAKFIRAVCYFYLVRGWGDVSIQEVDNTTRASKDDVYKHIEKDLLDAIAVLPEKDKYAAKDLGRATKGAAQGLLSKVYLYQEKWQEAYDYAKILTTSSIYGLEIDYTTIWHAETENGIESLFEFQGRGEAEAHGIQQYSKTQAPRGGNVDWGWGFNIPSQNLLDAFNAEGDNIRRDATIIFNNSTLYDGKIVSNTENPMYNMKAYSSAYPSADDGDKNIRYLRLGEIYLIEAEAANELGKTTEALAALNKIRSRVSLANETTTDKVTLRKAIWKERRLELAFEHDRWFDLNRTGQGEVEMKAAGKPYITGKHELLPVPSKQLLDVPSLGQNPGWK